jgi:hypothetical protein
MELSDFVLPSPSCCGSKVTALVVDVANKGTSVHCKAVVNRDERRANERSLPSFVWSALFNHDEEHARTNT